MEEDRKSDNNPTAVAAPAAPAPEAPKASQAPQTAPETLDLSTLKDLSTVALTKIARDLEIPGRLERVAEMLLGDDPGVDLGEEAGR